MTSWLTRHAALIAACSAVAHLAVAFCAADMFDLRVYREGSPGVLTGHLYDFRLARADPGALALPFTYPPFAALVFLPLAYLPWWLTQVLWQLLSLTAALYLVRGSFALLHPDRPAEPARILLWTAAVLWLEPLLHGLALGQVSLPLAALSLAAALRPGPLAAGTGIGLAAGVKLTPAGGVLYLLAAGRRRAAGWAAATFAATVVLAALVAPVESWRYWGHLLGDSGRIGPLASVENQSLRGCLARLLGQDGGVAGLWWPAGVLLAAAATAYAMRAAVRRGDRLAVLLAAQFFVLLASPVSWSHHWVWVVPALVWLRYGSLRGRRLSRAAVVVWALTAGTWMVPALHAVAPAGRAVPWPVAVAACAYPLAAALTLAAVASSPRTGPAPVPVAAGTAWGSR
ncbi:glycosyltransferase 87 family protein [Streptomyces cirratus]|uniref:glycosyltransferase 87 family protein n=1 Tax=Streptomyces cirratus TaxID=68187 RepID=UPI00167F0EC9|nr:glycosyltransferase 87 family protein [Streptomyces cirratus]